MIEGFVYAKEVFVATLQILRKPELR